MYTRSYWDVLVVDSDRDVVSVTRQALKGLEVYGIPIKITPCASKAEAIERLRDPVALPDLSLGIIDMVLETEHAGLELCDYIRNEMENRVTPLIVRTGKAPRGLARRSRRLAGLVPEETVMDDHDITAFISKVEATTERLRTLVKSALRSFLYTRQTVSTSAWAHRLVESCRSREELLACMRQCMVGAMTGADGERLQSLDGHMAFVIEDACVGIGDLEDPAAAFALDRELDGKNARSFSPGAFIQDGERVRIAVDAEGRYRAISFVARTNLNPVPDHLVRPWIRQMRTLRGLWSLLG